MTLSELRKKLEEVEHNLDYHSKHRYLKNVAIVQECIANWTREVEDLRELVREKEDAVSDMTKFYGGME